MQVLVRGDTHIADIDLKKRSESGDFVASVIEYGLNLESATREELVNIICETPAINKTLRQNFEEMSSDELRDVVDDAIKLIVQCRISFGTDSGRVSEVDGCCAGWVQLLVFHSRGL